MNIILIMKMALKSIVSNKIRSLLTMLGVIIGVSSVIAVTSFAKGSTKSITSNLESLGTNLVSINITSRDSNRTVTYEEMKTFKEAHTDIIQALAPSVTSSVTAKVGTENQSTSLIGTSPEYEAIKNVHVTNGRFITDMDLEYSQKVAMIGTYVAKNLFGSINPVGDTIKINGEVFKIIGVLEERASSEASTDDDQIIVPVTVATRLIKNSKINSFSMQATTAAATTEVVNITSDFLTKKLGTSSTGQKMFRVFNLTQMLSSLNSITTTLTVVLAGIAAISLIVGGVGIMNIMLVSVTERTREIGIRKAIGAKKKNILTQFLIEAMVITGFGGIIGVTLGLSIVKFIIGGFNIVPVVYAWSWVVISFGFSLVIGVVFGFYPAQKAAKLSPIDALMFD